ncbi:sodium transport system permease protein [Lysobacter niastensis]|uniref:Sodium transport system permease protein n=2 Tax=Lysobacter niastensis TaxID=380629 RepID=A0ABU1W5R9_9GAMM|nr:ABC transporter permease [Lysobacter niastensis]MDR7132918.1 sodium transport system permease protein [Lysobacter niastensis]
MTHMNYKHPNAFATAWSVLRKELRDISRDRRTLALALLLGPLLYPVLMIGIGKLAESRARTQLDQVLDVPTIGIERAPNLVAFLATQGIKATAAPANLDAAIASQDVDVGLRIDANYARDWREGRPALVEVVQDSTRRNTDIPSARVRAALSAYRDQVGALRLLARGIDPSVTRALNVGSRDLATEDAKRGLMMSSILPYLLILMSFLGGAYLIMDATAGERERQSLEPLLATPAKRGAIVSGKIAAACVLGLTSLLLTLLAFKLSAQMAGGTAKMMDVRFAAIGRMLLILLPMLFIGTTLLTYLSAAAKSMKEAQSHMTWLMLLPMLPTIALAVNPIKTQLWQFAVPFLAQNQLLLKVIRGEAITPQVWAIYLAAGFGVAALLWYAAVRRYHQERLAISG